jgi:transposase
MRTAYKCRAYPDPEQVHVLNRTFGCVRVAWNQTLAWRRQRDQADRDINAAKNILAAGLAVAGGQPPGHACGADVRHPGPPV